MKFPKYVRIENWFQQDRQSTVGIIVHNSQTTDHLADSPGYEPFITTDTPLGNACWPWPYDGKYGKLTAISKEEYEKELITRLVIES